MQKAHEAKRPKDEKTVQEILRICKDLGVTVDSKVPDAKHKYLSAWHKRIGIT